MIGAAPGDTATFIELQRHAGMHRVRLGNYAHISVSVRNLDESAPFYLKLGFKHLWGSAQPHPWAIMTDGKVNLHLYQYEFPSPALHYFSDHMKDKVLELMRLGIRPDQHKSKDGARTQHTFSDPSDFTIMLMHHSDADMPKVAGKSHARLGTIGEVSISTASLMRSLDFWQQLDFAVIARSDTPHPWAVLTDGNITLGLHETDAFTSPAFTYFAGDVDARIRLLQGEGVPIAQEMFNAAGERAGAVLKAPDGQLFLLLTGRASE